MKIFSNFDTQFKTKLLNKKKEKFSEDSIFVIVRSKYYLLFQVIFPFFLFVILVGVIHLFLEKNEFTQYAQYPLFMVWTLIIWFIFIRRLLKFLYDFTIIDPKGITTYKQKGFFYNYLKQIPTRRIRSVQIYRKTFLGNIFGYGSIDVLTDFMDNMHIGEENEAPSVIGITYVDKPYKVESQITEMCFK